MSVKVIGFDADDTLWVNENYFREAEKKFCKLVGLKSSEKEAMTLLYEAEMSTLDIYGFGIKGFVLSMLETATKIMGGFLTHDIVNDIISIGKEMLNKPVELLDDVEHILTTLQNKYRLILVTKGDLLDQERKLEKSGISHYFHHIEIMSNKRKEDYKKLIQHLDIQPQEFLMIGNSLRSDIVPVLKIGGSAIYVPYDIMWQHESIDDHDLEDLNYKTVPRLSAVLDTI